MYNESEMIDLEQQRGVLHDQLMDATGKDIRRRDMPRYARSILNGEYD